MPHNGSGKKVSMEGNKTKENGIAMRPLKAKNATAISYDEGSATLRIVKSDGSKVSFHGVSKSVYASILATESTEKTVDILGLSNMYKHETEV